MPAEPSQSHAHLPSDDAVADVGHWEALMLRAQDGDRAAYHSLLRAITPWLRAVVRRHLGCGEDVEDVLQDVLLVIHRIRHTYERGRPFRPWLATIAERRCIDLLRRRGRRLRHHPDPELMPPEPAAGDRGPLEASAHDQDAHALHRAVDALPERQREAVLLLRLQELSLQEAAERSGQSVGSLKVACHRALKSLRRALSPDPRND